MDTGQLFLFTWTIVIVPIMMESIFQLLFNKYVTKLDSITRILLIIIRIFFYYYGMRIIYQNFIAEQGIYIVYERNFVAILVIIAFFGSASFGYEVFKFKDAKKTLSRNILGYAFLGYIIYKITLIVLNINIFDTVLSMLGFPSGIFGSLDIIPFVLESIGILLFFSRSHILFEKIFGSISFWTVLGVSLVVLLILGSYHYDNLWNIANIFHVLGLAVGYLSAKYINFNLFDGRTYTNHF